MPGKHCAGQSKLSKRSGSDTDAYCCMQPLHQMELLFKQQVRQSLTVTFFLFSISSSTHALTHI
jgi:hypothetical protein